MIVVTVFLSILNQMEFHLVQNQKENCNHDHIPFNVKGNGTLVFSAWNPRRFRVIKLGHRVGFQEFKNYSLILHSPNCYAIGSLSRKRTQFCVQKRNYLHWKESPFRRSFNRVDIAFQIFLQYAGNRLRVLLKFIKIRLYLPFSD